MYLSIKSYFQSVYPELVEGRKPVKICGQAFLLVQVQKALIQLISLWLCDLVVQDFEVPIGYHKSSQNLTYFAFYPQQNRVLFSIVLPKDFNTT